VPCRVIAGRIDPSFAEIERHVFGTDWLVVCYIVTKTPDDMAVPATDWLASSNLEHQVIRRAEAVGLLSVRATVYHRLAGAGMRCTVQAKTDHRRSAVNISSFANSALGEHCRHHTDGIRQCRPLTRMRRARSARLSRIEGYESIAIPVLRQMRGSSKMGATAVALHNDPWLSVSSVTA
jgi:hypothetical protein